MIRALAAKTWAATRKTESRVGRTRTQAQDKRFSNPYPQLDAAFASGNMRRANRHSPVASGPREPRFAATVPFGGRGLEQFPRS